MASQHSDLSNLDAIAFGESSISSPSIPLESQASASDISSPILSTSYRRRTADIWQHCLYPQSTVIRNKQGAVVWTCRICRIQYMISGGTATIRKHLTNKHRLDVSSSNETRINGYQQGIDESFARVQASQQSSQYKRRRLDSSKDEGLLDPAVLEDLYIRWITAASIPFEMVGNNEFRQYIPLLFTLFLSLLANDLGLQDILIAKSMPSFLQVAIQFGSG
jgi:hypothetical protein